MKATNRFCRRFLFVLCLFLFSASSKGRVQAASLNASSLNLLKGQSFSLYLSEEEDTVSFESKNPGIAAVSEDGTVTGVSGGIAKIICEIFPSMPSKIGPPIPAGSPEITHSMTPPTESQSILASSILAFIFSEASSEIAGKSFFAHAARSSKNFLSLGS